MILWISEIVSFFLLVKNSFNFKLGFFSYFESISGGIIRKDILHSDYHSTRWYWCKKDQKNLPQTSYKFFPNAWLWICYEHLWFKTFVKIHFQEVKADNFKNLQNHKKPLKSILVLRPLNYPPKSQILTFLWF